MNIDLTTRLGLILYNNNKDTNNKSIFINCTITYLCYSGWGDYFYYNDQLVNFINSISPTAKNNFPLVATIGNDDIAPTSITFNNNNIYEIVRENIIYFVENISKHNNNEMVKSLMLMLPLVVDSQSENIIDKELKNNNYNRVIVLDSKVYDLIIKILD